MGIKEGFPLGAVLARRSLDKEKLIGRMEVGCSRERKRHEQGLEGACSSGDPGVLVHRELLKQMN